MWVYAAAGGGICCCLIILVALLLAKRRSKKTKEAVYGVEPGKRRKRSCLADGDVYGKDTGVDINGYDEDVAPMEPLTMSTIADSPGMRCLSPQALAIVRILSLLDSGYGASADLECTPQLLLLLLWGPLLEAKQIRCKPQ